MAKKTILTLLFCFCFIFGYAQESNNSELLKKLVEKNILTQSEADEIKQDDSPTKEKLTLNQSVQKIREGFNTPQLKFGGYGLLMYEYSQYNNVHHTIKPRLIFLSMGGKLTEHFRYYILADFANPMLFEYYGEWMPDQAFNLRAGQFKVPLTFENQISLTDLETILNTRSVASLAGMGYDVLVRLGATKNGAGRDIGIQASGSFLNTGERNLIQYAAGVFQGAGINLPDNNNAKDFSATLSVLPAKGLKIGAGVYTGTAHYTQTGTDTGKDYKRDRWVLSADYHNDRFYARSEWLHGKDGDIKEEGLYGTALWYFIPKKLNAVGKVDYYNENKNINSEVIDYTVGLNYYFAPQCRFQVNYTYSDYSKSSNTRSFNAVQAQMQVVF